MGNSFYGGDHHISFFVMLDPEGFVKSQLANSEILIEPDHILHKFCTVFCLRQGSAHITDPVSDAPVKHFPGVLCRLIAADDPAARCMKQSVKSGKVKGIQVPEYLKIMKGKLLNASSHSSPDLTGCTECIFVIYQKKRQIIMPEISRKAVSSRHLHQFSYTPEKYRLQTVRIFPVIRQRIHQFCHFQ